jgi:purine nucleosidase
MGTLTPPSAPPVKAGAAKAAHVMAQKAAKHGTDLTIVAIGPLTNLAAAYRLAPALMRSVGRVISMGGAFHVPGNTGPVAEFNYFVDPHAVETVLSLASDLLIVPLDVTEQLILTWKDAERLTQRPSARWRQRLLRGYMQYHELTEGFLGAYLHDPIAVAEAIQPGILHAEPADVSIVAREGPARGLTSEKAPTSRVRQRTQIARSLDAPAFLELFDRFWTAV